MLSALDRLPTPYPYRLPRREDLLEVVDGQDRPLLLMPQSLVFEQHLPYRQVRVTLCDDKYRVALIRHRLPGTSVSPFQLPGTRTRPGEARETAVQRTIQQAMAITPENITPLSLPSHTPLLAFFTAHVPLYAPRPRAVGVEELLFVDLDEALGLALHFPDMLDQELAQIIGNGSLATLLTAARHAR